MQKIYIGLGSNIGNKLENIKLAIKLLSNEIFSIKVANIYISKAYGYENQENFLNTAISGYTNLKPLELLNFTQQIEKKVGKKYRFHWGPREIDIDILLISSLKIKRENLIVPHPFICERDFVLKPLIELDKSLIHPVYKKPILTFYKNLKNHFIIGKI